MKKNETYENFVYSFNKILFEMKSKILLYTQKTLPEKNCIVLLDWLYNWSINSAKVESHK